MANLKQSFFSGKKTWINSLKEMFLTEETTHEEITIQLAIAVLLVEMMKMDGKLDLSEEELLTKRLIHHFKLDDEAVKKLTVRAHAKLKEATDYHQFTQALNKQLSIAEKIELLESLWMMAAADGKIDAHENHLIRKIADLLHLRHSEFVRIKDRVLRNIG